MYTVSHTGCISRLCRQTAECALLHYSIFVLLQFLKPIPPLSLSLLLWNGCRQLSGSSSSPGQFWAFLSHFSLKSPGSFPHLCDPTVNPFRQLSKRRDGFLLDPAHPTSDQGQNQLVRKGRLQHIAFEHLKQL